MGWAVPPAESPFWNPPGGCECSPDFGAFPVEPNGLYEREGDMFPQVTPWFSYGLHHSIAYIQRQVRVRACQILFHNGTYDLSYIGGGGGCVFPPSGVIISDGFFTYYVDESLYSWQRPQNWFTGLSDAYYQLSFAEGWYLPADFGSFGDIWSEYCAIEGTGNLIAGQVSNYAPYRKKPRLPSAIFTHAGGASGGGGASGEWSSKKKKKGQSIFDILASLGRKLK